MPEIAQTHHPLHIHIVQHIGDDIAHILSSIRLSLSNSDFWQCAMTA
jgi:hypothetical protein